MAPGQKRFLGVSLRLLGTVLCFWWAFSQIEDKKTFGENLKASFEQPLWIILGVVLSGLTILAGAVRWYALLKAQQIPVRFSQVLRLTFVGSLFTIVSFGEAAGDAYKIIHMIRRFKDRKAQITMSIIIDHLGGFISAGILFVFFALSSGAIMDAKMGFVKHALIGTLVFNLVGITVVVAMFCCSSDQHIRKFTTKFPRLAGKRHISSIMNSLNLYRHHWKGLIISLIASFGVSASYYLVFYAALKSINAEVGCGTVITVMPLVDAISSLPISVAGLGVRENTFEFLLSSLSEITSSAAISASLIGFMFHLLWAFIGACVWFLWKDQSEVTTLE